MDLVPVRRPFGIVPGLTGDVGKRGVSTSIGVRGAHVTLGPTGTRTTVGLQGSGLSYTHLERPGQGAREASGEVVQTSAMPRGQPMRGWLWAVLTLAIAGVIAWQTI